MTIILTHSDSLTALASASVPKMRTWIWDPPYNIGFKYEGCDDSMKNSEYHLWIGENARLMREKSVQDGANLFLIIYPEIAARLLPFIEKSGWKLTQWLSWTYPSNFGHSTHRFTRASRAILHFTIGTPHFHHQTFQPYRNPNDKRIRKLMESGRKGTAHYDWLPVNLVKNVSAEKRYSNQIPEALLRILILNTTNEGEWVGDPMVGSGSSVRTAAKNYRHGWGNDLSPVAVSCWNDLKVGE